MITSSVRTPLSEQVATSTPAVERSADSSPPTRASESPAAPRPPYGGETPDYQTWKYGYPLLSGRMFGSGN